MDRSSLSCQEPSPWQRNEVADMVLVVHSVASWPLNLPRTWWLLFSSFPPAVAAISHNGKWRNASLGPVQVLLAYFAFENAAAGGSAERSH